MAVQAEAATLAVWVQLGAANEISARAITDVDACHTLRVDNVPLLMRTRADPRAGLGNVSNADFPERVCEAVLPPGSTVVLLDDKPLPLRRLILPLRSQFSELREQENRSQLAGYTSTDGRHP